jgi:hypothetical protein
MPEYPPAWHEISYHRSRHSSEGAALSGFHSHGGHRGIVLRLRCRRQITNPTSAGIAPVGKGPWARSSLRMNCPRANNLRDNAAAAGTLGGAPEPVGVILQLKLTRDNPHQRPPAGATVGVGYGNWKAWVVPSSRRCQTYHSSNVATRTSFSTTTGTPSAC